MFNNVYIIFLPPPRAAFFIKILVYLKNSAYICGIIVYM